MKMTKILSLCLIVSLSVVVLNCGQQKSAKLDRIHFDFDKSFVRNDMIPTLDKNVSKLKNSKKSMSTVTVEGHCDERGSNEYNYALGAERAAAVKSYYVSHGVSASRVKTVSYGEDKPLKKGSDEENWYMNRRAESK